jgi:tetratricopeptide (TPR) repeat protein
LECYERALVLNTKLDRTWMNKGIALNALGRHEEALSSYGKAIELNPRLDQAWYLRGLTLVNVFQRYREALPYLEEAERLGSKEASETLVMCQSAVGRK